MFDLEYNEFCLKVILKNILLLQLGYRGNGNIQIHPFWTDVHSEEDEAFFEALAQQVKNDTEIQRELKLETDMELSLIEKELRSKLVAGVKNSKEDGKFFWNDNEHDYPGSKVIS